MNEENSIAKLNHGLPVAFLKGLTEEQFTALPFLKEGESKEIRDAGTSPEGVRLCVIRLKPTIYSFTANRTGIVPGSDLLRLRATKVFTEVLREAGIKHAYLEVGDKFILSEYVENDPNVEVIVKAFHSGTSKHRYHGMSGRKVRAGSLWEGMSFEDMGAYPCPVVRFDWRNPFEHPVSRVKLADEVMPEDIADWWIDTRAARATAMRTYSVLQEFLAARDIVLYDLCLFVSADGKTLFGEVSQDCGRFRHFDLGELDKDVWRAGGSHAEVLEKWALLCQMLEA
jgi:phosphoribosylaminoimidazole-succinocarboxamide synthase